MGRKKFDPMEAIRNAAAFLGQTVDLPDASQLDAARREADSVVLYLENPEKFRTAECRQCGHRFATNYSAVAMCSDHCRILWLHNIGIEWNPAKTQAERWAGNIPLVVGPDALALANSVLELEKADRAAHQ